MNFLKLQIEKQRLEIQLLELDAKAKASSFPSPAISKPPPIPSLDYVRSGNNAGKSQGQLDHNTRILIHKNGRLYTFLSAFPVKNLRISRLLNSFMASWTS